jgi:predicted hydrocarbon binding protein
MTEKTVSDGAVRAVMDGAEDIIGGNGLKSLLNYAGLSSLITNRPEYGYQKLFTDDEYGRLISSFYSVLGVKGARAIFRLVGHSIGKRTTTLGFYDHFKDLPQKEKLFKMVETYGIVSGRGKVLLEGNTVIYHNPSCSTCGGIADVRPVCTIITGIIDEFALWVGYEGLKTVETQCKALGNEACRYEIEVPS